MEGIEKILVICISGIGNTILFTPTLKLLRSQFPKAKIIMLCQFDTSKEMVSGSHYVDDIIVFDLKKYNTLAKKAKFIVQLRKQRFDVSMIAFPSNRIEYNLLAFLVGARYRITHKYPVGYFKTLSFLQNIKVPALADIHDVYQNLNLLRLFGIDPIASPVFMWVTDEDRRYADKFLSRNGIDKSDLTIGIHTGSSKGMSFKRWPQEYFVQVCEALHDKYEAKMVLFGGPDELGLAKEIAANMKNKPVICANNTLKQTAAIIERCSLFVNSDSGLGHIAAAMKTPTVTLFGPTNPRRIAPYGDDNIVIKKDLPCSPCYQYPFYQCYSRIKCDKMDCLKEISVEDVLEAVEKQISKTGRGLK